MPIFWGEQSNDSFFSIAALKDVYEHVGGSASFKYKLPHDGAPIEWIHNGKRIYPERDPKKYDVISDGLVKTLVIKDLKEDEQGTFGVKVGEKTNTAKLLVQGLCLAYMLNAYPCKVFTFLGINNEWIILEKI